MRLVNKIKKLWTKITFIWLYLVTSVALADDGIIPISQDEQIQSGESYSEVFKKILKNEVLPIIEFGVAILFVSLAAIGVHKGYKKAHEEHDSHPFTSSIINAVIFVVVGASLVYLLQYIGTKIN